MTTTEDARTWARRIVEETLVEAGLVAPSETSGAIPQDDGPPPPPSLARQAAHRIVEAVQREHEAVAASQAPSDAAVDDAEVDDVDADPAEPHEAEVASNGHQRSDDSEAANRARRIVAEVVAAEEAKRAAEEADRAKRAAEQAEQARQAEEAAAQTAELVVAPEATAEMPTAPAGRELFTEPSPVTEPQAERRSSTDPELFTEPDADTELDFDPDADPGLAFEPESDTEPEAASPPATPTPSVDLLPAEPTGPPHADLAGPGASGHPDEPTADMVLDHHEAPSPSGRLVDGPPPPPIAMIDGWWQRIRARYRRRQAMAQWAPDATRPPRRTGRWLLVTIIAVAAIALLFPMAVDALRQLVAL